MRAKIKTVIVAILCSFICLFVASHSNESLQDIARYRELARQGASYFLDNNQSQPEMVSADDNNGMTSPEEFEARLSRVKQVCKKDEISGWNTVFPFKDAGALYCYVPKAGCTFWKRLFLVYNDSKTEVSKDRLFDIPRLDIHDLAKNGQGFDKERHSYGKFPLRFMVARDPFSRMVSAYLDKIYLPDLWLSNVYYFLRNQNLRGPGFEQALAEDFLRVDMDNIHATFGKDTAKTENISNTLQDDFCGKYATFREFVMGDLRSKHGEKHSAPIHVMCDPCKFNVTHVSTMETFARDARAIIHQMGLGAALDGFDDHNQVEEELNMIVEYNFKLVVGYLSNFYQKCIGPRELAYRLWNNFRWRGYIHPEVEYVIPEVTLSSTEVKTHLYDQISKARARGLEDPEVMKRAKQKFKVDLFKTLTKELFVDVMERFRYDFELFGYEDLRETYSALYL